MLTDVLAVIRAFYRNAYWETSQATLYYGEGFVLSYSGKQWQSGANQLWVDHPDILNSVTLDTASHFFRQWYADWSCLIIPEAQPFLYSRALQLGGYTIWSNPVMVAEKQLPSPPMASPIHVQSPHGMAQYDLVYRILCEAYQLTYSPQQELFRPAEGVARPLQHCLAWYDSHPAAIGTLNWAEGLGGIWNVATRPVFRRKGLARAVMHYLGQQAAHLNATMLLATSAGYGLYQQLGYRTVGTGHYMNFGMY